MSNVETTCAHARFITVFMRFNTFQPHQVAIQSELVVQDFVGLDLDVGCLALGAAQRLVDHDARVWQTVPFTLQQS